MISSLFGYIAAICTTISFVPQAVKVHKTRSTKDISFGMFLLMTAGVAFWLIYGLMINSLPIIAANAVTLFLSFYILLMKIRLDHTALNQVK
ncbi:MAG TPA: SemiSWEET transporter [Ignavibacteriaceae bacterium]|nr:SemiSWEET transporter [Ignavibacteriaceae bacterium]